MSSMSPEVLRRRVHSALRNLAHVRSELHEILAHVDQLRPGGAEQQHRQEQQAQVRQQDRQVVDVGCSQQNQNSLAVVAPRVGGIALRKFHINLPRIEQANGDVSDERDDIANDVSGGSRSDLGDEVIEIGEDEARVDRQDQVIAEREIEGSQEQPRRQEHELNAINQRPVVMLRDIRMFGSPKRGGAGGRLRRSLATSPLRKRNLTRKRQQQQHRPRWASKSPNSKRRRGPKHQRLRSLPVVYLEDVMQLYSPLRRQKSSMRRDAASLAADNGVILLSPRLNLERVDLALASNPPSESVNASSSFLMTPQSNQVDPLEGSSTMHLEPRQRRSRSETPKDTPRARESVDEFCQGLLGGEETSFMMEQGDQEPRDERGYHTKKREEQKKRRSDLTLMAQIGPVRKRLDLADDEENHD